MNAKKTTTRFSTYVPQASCIAVFLAALSLLPLAGSSKVDATPVFCLSASLAVIALVLGIVGLFVTRPKAYSVAGIILSSVVLLFWAFVLLCMVLMVMISLP